MKHSVVRHFRTLLFSGLPLAAPIFAPDAALAQTATVDQTAPPAAEVGLSDIVVTASKREQNSQKVGMTIAALQSSELRQLNVMNSADIVKHVTGMNLTSPLGEGNNPVFSLRGVGLNDFGENNEAPVAVYVDEVYNATLAGLSFSTYDLERVEVLKGPQGTLYGRNSTGGLMHYITAKPSQNFGGYVSASYGRYNERRAEAAVTGPLVEGLSARLSGVYSGQDPYVKNRVGRNTNEADSVAGRFQLLYDAPSGGSVLLSVHAGRTDTTAPSYQHRSVQYDANGAIVDLPANVSNPGCLALIGADTGPGNDCFGYRDTDGDPYANAVDRQGMLNVKSWGASGKVTWPLGDVTLTSLTAYEYVRKDWGEDTDVGPTKAFEITNKVRSKQFSQELRLNGEIGDLKWIAGGYYFYRLLNGFSQLDMTGLGLGFPRGTYRDQTTSISGFGQLEYTVSPLVTLIGGLRYTQDRKPYDYYAADPTGLTVTPPTGVDPAAFRFFQFNQATAGKLALAKASLWSYRAEVDFNVAPTAMIYVSASQGTKGPGFISGTLAFFGPEPFNNIQYSQETLRSYEGGVKSRFLDNKVQLNAAVFYYDYKGLQAVSFVNTLARVLNKDARIYGAEAELTMRPATGLDITLAGSVLDAKFEGTGKELPAAPPFQLNGKVRYNFPVGSGNMAVTVDGSITGGQFFDIQNNPSAREGSYGLLNANLSYMPTDKLTLSVWAKNITKSVYRVYTIPVADFGFQQDMMGRPRWFGATARYDF